MSREIVLIADAKNEQGVQKRAGDSFTCSDSYADYLVNNNQAAYIGAAVGLVPRAVLTSGQYALRVGDGVYALSEATPYVNLTATGTAFTGACELAGYDCTVAAGNITIYDNTSAAGTVMVPTTALTVGRVEFGYRRALALGCHVVLSGAATVNVLVG